MKELNTVTITIAEYRKLTLRDLELDCLESHGVDNWDGYPGAMGEYIQLMNEREENK